MSDMPIIEPMYCPDVFAEGIAKVEPVGGGCVRLWYYSETIEDGRRVRTIVAKMIRPISGLVDRAGIMALIKRADDYATVQ